MIRIGQIQLSLYLKNKTPFDAEKLAPIKEAITAYKYPVGIIADDMINQNPLYENAELDENISYLLSILEFLFKDIYSIQEINIIVAYLIMSYYTHFSLNNKFKTYLYSFIQLSSDKPEIQFYIDEIKYRYLLSLIYSHSTQEEKELINTLSTELSLIEEQHNKFTIHEQYI